MSKMRKKFIVGNWKMYKDKSQVAEFVQEILKIYRDNEEYFTNVEVGVCPPSLYVDYVADKLKDTEIKVFAQNCYFKVEGAFTGEISPEMLKSVGAFGSIVGHSERREIFGETDEIVNEKIKAILEKGLIPIMCVGETIDQREEGKAKEIVENQLINGLRGISKEDVEEIIVAYEPIWAIGTGKTATSDEAEEMCGFIRSVIERVAGKDSSEKVRIQYGGSVKPENSREILEKENIDGALVGGASLKANSFFEIIDYK